MKKYIFDMKFFELPTWIQIMTYMLFVLFIIPFIIPCCAFSYYCLLVWGIISVVYITTICMFPYQKVRKNYNRLL